jgi:ABC-type phosphate/phosphonate transport system permease subunit
MLAVAVVHPDADVAVGFELQLAMKVLRYPDVLALILLVIVLITGMERVSDLIRRSLLRSDTLK